jgi:hypothetical protein
MHSDLFDLSILKQAVGINFPVTIQQAAAVEDLLDRRNITLIQLVAQ